MQSIRQPQTDQLHGSMSQSKTTRAGKRMSLVLSSTVVKIAAKQLLGSVQGQVGLESLRFIIMKQSFSPSRKCPDGGQAKDVYIKMAHMKNSISLMETARWQ